MSEQQPAPAPKPVPPPKPVIIDTMKPMYLVEGATNPPPKPR